MSTTLLMIEYLLTGILTACAILLGLHAFGLDLSWLRDPPIKSDLLIALVACAIVYPLGIFTDELADRLSKPWTDKLRENANLQLTQSVQSLLAGADAVFARALFDHKRSRIRIARSTALNLLLLVVVGSFALPKKLNWADTLALELVLILLAGFACWTWHALQKSWFNTLKTAWQESGIKPKATIEAIPATETPVQ
jgi:ABC-type multidrug transport system fused ATPase/permease subunit